MQNNNNFQIAKELDAISIKINDLDKSNVSGSINEIHTFHREIEQIARQYEITTLLAIVDWVDLSTELNDENLEQIDTLLTTDAYSNWIDVIVSLLKDYNDNLRPIIHQSLTTPKWVVKPSTILLSLKALLFTPYLYPLNTAFPTGLTPCFIGPKAAIGLT